MGYAGRSIALTPLSVFRPESVERAVGFFFSYGVVVFSLLAVETSFSIGFYIVCGECGIYLNHAHFFHALPFLCPIS